MKSFVITALISLFAGSIAHATDDIPPEQLASYQKAAELALAPELFNCGKDKARNVLPGVYITIHNADTGTISISYSEVILTFTQTTPVGKAIVVLYSTADKKSVARLTRDTFGPSAKNTTDLGHPVIQTTLDPVQSVVCEQTTDNSTMTHQ